MAETNALALLPYSADLFGGMVDLLQLESVPMITRPSKKPTKPPEPNTDDQGSEKGSGGAKAEDVHGEDGQDVEAGPPSHSPPLTMDTHPTAADSKFPPLRRAALHFLALLIRACISRVYDMGSTGMLIPDAHITRARTTLGYVTSTDEDVVVRVMAREARDGLGQLSNALLGL